MIGNLENCLLGAVKQLFKAKALLSTTAFYESINKVNPGYIRNKHC